MNTTFSTDSPDTGVQLDPKAGEHQITTDSILKQSILRALQNTTGKVSFVDKRRMPTAWLQLGELKIHPLCDLFPQMTEKEIMSLASDIKQNGQQESIKLYQGQVLDGRNRLWACQLLGREPKFEHITPDDPLAYVISQNSKRRTLSTSQRAWVAAEMAEELCKMQICSSVTEAISKAASVMGVSKRSVSTANAVRKNCIPEAHPIIKLGRLNISAAYQLSTLSTEKQKDLLRVHGIKLTKPIKKATDPDYGRPHIKVVFSDEDYSKFRQAVSATECRPNKFVMDAISRYIASSVIQDALASYTLKQEEMRKRAAANPHPKSLSEMLGV